MNKKLFNILLLSAAIFNGEAISSGFGDSKTDDPYPSQASKHLKYQVSSEALHLLMDKYKLPHDGMSISYTSKDQIEEVYKAFYEAALKEADDPIKVEDLWKLQRAFALETGENLAQSCPDGTITADRVYKAFHDAALKVPNDDSETLEKFWEHQMAFDPKAKENLDLRWLFVYTIPTYRVYNAYGEEGRKVAGDPIEVQKLYTRQKAFALETEKDFLALKYPAGTISTDRVYKAFYEAALKEADDPIKVEDLWKLQRAFALETGENLALRYPAGTISTDRVYKAFYEAALKEADDPIKVEDLWKLQRAFALETGENLAQSCPDGTITADRVYKAFHDAALKVPNDDSETLEKFWEHQMAFDPKAKENFDLRWLFVYTIPTYRVYNAYGEEGRKVAGDPIEVQKLYTRQKAFAQKTEKDFLALKYPAGTITADEVHTAYVNKLKRRDLTPDDRITTHEAYVNFGRENPTIASRFRVKTQLLDQLYQEAINNLPQKG